MIELLFVACLYTEPDKCRERSLVFTGITPMQCMMGAQPILAEWVETHPHAQIRSWHCRAVTFAERDG